MIKIDFSLTKEQEEIREKVRMFAETEIAPVVLELDEKEEFSVELTKKMGKLGLFGMIVPKEYGGQGMDYLSYVIAVEELARVDGSQAITVVAHNSLGVNSILHYGTEEQKKKYLPKLSTGELICGFGLSEPDAGSDTRGTVTTAVLDGDEWVINGCKNFITNCGTDITLGTVVMCNTSTSNDEEANYSNIIVESGTPGFKQMKMRGKFMWRTSSTAELFFDNCRVPKDAVLGKRGDGLRQALGVLDEGRLGTAAMGVGGAQGAYEMALKYAQERKQFGSPICKFQAVAFKLADCAIEIECARNLLYKSCWLVDNKQPFSKEAAMAKVYCSELMGRVVNHSMQIHASVGMMKDCPVERFYRDQKVLDVGEGTSEIQRVVVSRLIGC